MFDLTGMTALVTGASGGIGSEIAKALAAQGARLAVSGSNADKLEAFRAGLGGDHVALPCDLGDGAAVDQLVPEAVAALGKLEACKPAASRAVTARRSARDGHGAALGEDGAPPHLARMATGDGKVARTVRRGSGCGPPPSAGTSEDGGGEEMLVLLFLG